MAGKPKMPKGGPALMILIGGHGLPKSPKSRKPKGMPPLMGPEKAPKKK